MFIGIEKDIIYLLRRKEIELRELLVGGIVEVDRCVMKGIEIGLQLLKIDF
jgi:hypothetical protein